MSITDKELSTLETINAVLNLLLRHDRSCVFRYSGSQLQYADDGVSNIRPKIELVVKALSLLCDTDYTAKRFVADTHSDNVSAACNLDTGDDAFERARCLHRVVRAMHDGHCPRCGWLAPSETFYVGAIYGRTALVQEGEHRCCYCEFTVTDSEAKKALAEFLPYLENSVRVFEEWRSKVHHE